MKIGDDLVKEFGVGKITYGLIGMPILAVCVAISTFLPRVSSLNAPSGMALGTAVVYLAGRWRESKDDVPNTADIQATTRGTHLVVSIISLI